MYRDLDEVKKYLPAHLHQYLEFIPVMGVVIKHPFYFLFSLSIMPLEQMKCIPIRIDEREKDFNDYCFRGQWMEALWTVQRPYRVDYLSKLMDQYGVERLISVVGDVWRDAEHIMDDEEAWELWGDIWRRILRTRGNTPRKRRYHVMTVDDRKTFNAMPDRLKVYRGYSVEGNEEGYSWTLNRSVAEWFARRFSDSNSADGIFIATMEISKDEVLAYFTGRDEEEIVVDLWNINFSRITIETLPQIVKVAA